MWKKIWHDVVNYLKKKKWYVTLLFMSSCYIIYYRNDIWDLSELNAMNLLFFLWLILLLYPLFSEVEIGNVKLKKEINEVKEATKEAFRELHLQIMDMKISNISTNANTLVVNNALPSEQELTEIKNSLKSDKKADEKIQSLEIDISDQNVYLFKIRLAIEKRVYALCDRMNLDGRRGMMAAVRYLVKHEVIDMSTADAIEQIIHIANRGVHGEIVSSKYIEFVNDVVPGILSKLDDLENKYHMCKQCGYYWYGGEEDICPNCGSKNR